MTSTKCKSIVWKVTYRIMWCFDFQLQRSEFCLEFLKAGGQDTDTGRERRNPGRSGAGQRGKYAKNSRIVVYFSWGPSQLCNLTPVWRSPQTWARPRSRQSTVCSGWSSEQSNLGPRWRTRVAWPCAPSRNWCFASSTFASPNLFGL